MEPTNSILEVRFAAARESQTRGRQQVISVMLSPRGIMRSFAWAETVAARRAAARALLVREIYMVARV